jgi:hypothetical protein
MSQCEAVHYYGQPFTYGSFAASSTASTRLKLSLFVSRTRSFTDTNENDMLNLYHAMKAQWILEV